MLEPHLFIGFAVDDEIEKGLHRANPHAVDLFIQNNSEYLHEAHAADTRYLGKYLTAAHNIEQLRMVENNIASLITKLVPNFDPTATTPVLFAVAKEPATA